MKFVKESLEPWPPSLMEEMLNQFELEQPLDEHSWEEVQDIMKALWIGYNFKKDI